MVAKPKAGGKALPSVAVPGETGLPVRLPPSPPGLLVPLPFGSILAGDGSGRDKPSPRPSPSRCHAPRGAGEEKNSSCQVKWKNDQYPKARQVKTH